MTLEEKAAQMICVWQQKKENLVDDRGRFDPAKAKAAFRERELARLPVVAIIRLFKPIRADFMLLTRTGTTTQKAHIYGCFVRVLHLFFQQNRRSSIVPPGL
jgi:hypothetical protein